MNKYFKDFKSELGGGYRQLCRMQEVLTLYRCLRHSLGCKRFRLDSQRKCAKSSLKIRTVQPCVMQKVLTLDVCCTPWACAVWSFADDSGFQWLLQNQSLVCVFLS